MANIKFETCQLFNFVVLLLVSLRSCIAQVEADLETVFTRRVEDILQSTYNPELAARWRDELTIYRNWSDVDYTAGCPARRANWPAQEHFQRIITMASLYNQDQSDPILLEKISEAMDYWFDDDYLEADCINAGGQDHLKCPCGTPGFWNTNWYDQMILMPGLIGNACLFLKPYLSVTQSANCTNQLSRAYVRIDGDPNGSMGPMTGANMLDVSSTGVTLALLTSDAETIQGALNRYYTEAQVTEGSADGIKADGSYMQHNSQLYTGNYGAVFMRALIKIFVQTGGTTLSPPESVQSAFLTLMRGTEWFIYSKDNLLNWQYSAIGRMVSHRYSDWNGIGLYFDELLEGTQPWSNSADFQEIVDRLRTTNNGVNPGPLIGSRFFYTTDYLVHRGHNYIVTLKMFSTRTTNSECNNSQNPYGFHLSDGNIYTYIRGDEYRDVYGAWDWNLIPGTTVDYGASKLACNSVEFKGKESFVGGVALGRAGVAVMNYTNPQTGSLQWSKAYFFFPGSYAVHFVGEISSATDAPVVTTLDQRQHVGPAYIDGELVEEEQVTKLGQAVWHDRVGYQLENPAQIVVDTKPRQSDWAAIGISQGNETQNLFAAYVSHTAENMADFAYFAYLDLDPEEFEKKSKSGLSGFTGASGGLNKNGGSKGRLLEPAVVRGAYYGKPEAPDQDRYVALAFWTAGEYETRQEDIARVDTDAPLVLLFQRLADESGWVIAVADPSQKLKTVNIKVYIGKAEVPLNIDVELPTGLLAGSGKMIFIN